MTPDRRRPCGPVVVIDDHDLMSSSLVLVMQRWGFDARRVRTPSPRVILAEVGTATRGVALVDLDLGTDPDHGKVCGVDLIAPLRAQGWQPVIMSGTVHEDEMAAGVAAGAVAVVRKAWSTDALVATVRTLLDGGRVMDPSERDAYLVRAGRAASERRRSADRLRHLTDRERQVLERLGDGYRAAAIAAEFVTSISTVRSQIRSVLAKLGVGSQLEAVALLHAAADR